MPRFTRSWTRSWPTGCTGEGWRRQRPAWLHAAAAAGRALPRLAAAMCMCTMCVPSRRIWRALACCGRPCPILAARQAWLAAVAPWRRARLLIRLLCRPLVLLQRAWTHPPAPRCRVHVCTQCRSQCVHLRPLCAGCTCATTTWSPAGWSPSQTSCTSWWMPDGRLGLPGWACQAPAEAAAAASPASLPLLARPRPLGSWAVSSLPQAARTRGALSRRAAQLCSPGGCWCHAGPLPWARHNDLPLSGRLEACLPPRS